MTDQPSARDVIAQELAHPKEGYVSLDKPQQRKLADEIIAALRAAGLWVAPWEPSFETVSMGGHAIWDHTSAVKHELICNAWAAMRDAYLQSKPGE